MLQPLCQVPQNGLKDSTILKIFYLNGVSSLTLASKVIGSPSSLVAVIVMFWPGFVARFEGMSKDSDPSRPRFRAPLLQGK